MHCPPPKQNTFNKFKTHSLAQSHTLPSTRVLLLHLITSLVQDQTTYSVQNSLHYPQSLHKSKPTGKTRSSDHLCLSLPPLTCKLKFSDRSFRNASPRLWNSLATNLRFFSQQIPTPSSPTPLPFNTLSLSRSQFLARIKTHLFSLSYSPSPIYGFQPVISAPLVTRVSTREYTNTIGFTGAI